MTDHGMELVVGLLEAFDEGRPADFAAARASLVAAADQQRALARQTGLEASARMLGWLENLGPVVGALEAGDREAAVVAFNVALRDAFEGFEP